MICVGMNTPLREVRTEVNIQSLDEGERRTSYV